MANTEASKDNTTGRPRKPIKHGTTLQAATRHAAGQHDTDRHSPPLIDVHIYVLYDIRMT